MNLPDGFRHDRRADMAAFVVANTSDLETAFIQLAEHLTTALGEPAAYAAVADACTSALAYLPATPAAFERCWFHGATRAEVARIGAIMRARSAPSH